MYSKLLRIRNAASVSVVDEQAPRWKTVRTSSSAPRSIAASERVGVEVVVEAQRREVAPLLGSVEPIGDEDAVVAAPVERPHERAADEPGAAGHQSRSRNGDFTSGAHGRCHTTGAPDRCSNGVEFGVRSHMLQPAVVHYALQPLAVELREVPVPEIGEGEALLAVGAVSVCGSDVHQAHNTHSWA